MVQDGVAAGVAAGHPATVAAGIEILEEGGSAADAAVAASLASCVAETLMTGLLGGGHAVYFDGEAAWNLDCFVDVPSGAGAAPVELRVPFGEELVHYAVGPGTCAVPGPPAGARRAAPPLRPARLAAARRAGVAAGPRGRDDAGRARRLPGHARPRLHDAARRRADLRAGGPVARDGRDARAARARDGVRTARRRGCRHLLRGLRGRAADGGRGGAGDGCRPGAIRGALGDAGRSEVARAARAHARRPLGRAGDTRAPAAPARSGRDGARACAARRARRGRGGRPHDEPRDRRRRRRRLRADVEPRPRAQATSSPGSTCS